MMIWNSKNNHTCGKLWDYWGLRQTPVPQQDKIRRDKAQNKTLWSRVKHTKKKAIHELVENKQGKPLRGIQWKQKDDDRWWQEWQAFEAFLA